MTSAKFGDVDFMKELRLRRWAREHYVAADDRRSTWHPIVLDEMAAKDAEDAETAELCANGLGYVPLAPSALHLIDCGHGAPQPLMTRTSAHAEVELYFHG